jgi:hypothetical protein
VFYSRYRRRSWVEKLLNMFQAPIPNWLHIQSVSGLRTYIPIA